jgi:hypothetical protein
MIKMELYEAFVSHARSGYSVGIAAQNETSEPPMAGFTLHDLLV